MHGNGTRPGITPNNPPPARLLDLSRLTSRAGRVATGVDRVEYAYLDALLQRRDAPLFGVVRTGLGFVLLDARALSHLAQRWGGVAEWGPADLLSRLARRKADMVRRAESDVRRMALARCRPAGLQKMLTRHLPKGASYINTGHSNLTARMMRAVKDGPRGRVAVLVHDMIPLDHPQFQRAGMPDLFGARMRRVSALADLVICNSDHTQKRVAHYMEGWGRIPPSAVAHLGVTLPNALPVRDPGPNPYFVAVGTLEPRKNHTLLLDIWDDMARDLGPDCPRLILCGARGWRNEEVFARLDAMPPNGPVQEWPDLSDGQLRSLVAGASASLFPSLAEGFGLPPVEAAALGVPVVCTPLEVLREVLGDIPIYLPESDRYQWRSTIESLARAKRADPNGRRAADFAPPSWQDHFNTVLSLV